MVKEAPFDAWDGEDLETDDVVAADAAEVDDAAEVNAMHVEPDGEERNPSHWSDLTGEMTEQVPDERPVSYFDDEQPERADPVADVDEQPEPDLEEILERQHYAFPPAE